MDVEILEDDLIKFLGLEKYKELDCVEDGRLSLRDSQAQNIISYIQLVTENHPLNQPDQVFGVEGGKEYDCLPKPIRRVVLKLAGEGIEQILSDDNQEAINCALGDIFEFKG